LPYWRLSAYYFCYFAFIGAFSPYFSLYLTSLAFSAWDIGVLMSLMQVMRVIAPNVWGWLADRLGVRTPIVRLGAVFSIAGFAVFFFTESFPGIFTGMVMLAFFWGAALPLVEALTLDHLGAQATRYGSIRLWGSVGFIAAVLGLGFVLDRAPLSAILWVSCVILCGILACAWILPEKAPTPHAAEPPRLVEILRRKDVYALLAACFAMSAAHGALYVFYSIYLVQKGYGTTAVGWLWTLGVVAEIGVFLSMPRLQRRFSLRTILLASFACAVVRFLLIGWGIQWGGVAMIAQLLHGATFGAYHAAAVAAINHWFTGRHQARGQALYSSVSFGAGGMIGGVLSGYTWDAIGAPLTYTFSSLFAAAGFILIMRGLPDSSSGSPVSR